jgi:putative tryptophan/tyrosine transport system substrate-binding protein
MKRRAACLIAVALGALGANTPLPSVAQEAGRVFRIGILSPAERPDTAVFEAFRKGLADLGYIDGQNIRIEYRLAAGDTSRLPAMAGELVRLPVDIIVPDGPKSAQIAHEATRTIPIVGPTLGADPVAAGLAASLARPGGNVTGFIGHGPEISAKRLQLLKEAAPAISRMAALWNPSGPVSVRRATEEAAGILGVELRTIEVAVPGEISNGFEAAAAGGAEALVVLPDAMFWNERARIVALAAKHRMPAIYPEREYADDGGLLAYGSNIPDQFRRAATYVDKILKGAKPADLPIQRPTRFEMVVNLKTAGALGLAIPQSILARADEVIE